MIRISESRLRALAPELPESPLALEARFQAAGIKLLRVLSLRDALNEVSAARVRAVEPHPDADRLRVCTVEVAEGESIQVVCGAPNVRAGGMYPLVRPGGYLPTGGKFKKAKLRGQVSEGMLCSARELEVASDVEGLLELPETLTLGAPLGDVLQGEGVVFEIEGSATPEEIAQALAAV